MGALLLAGLAIGGAAIGTAQTVASVRGGMGPGAPLVRATAIVAMAFAQGIGILGTVAGMLAIFVRDAGDASTGIVETVVAGAGAVIGLALIARAGDVMDSTIRAVGLMYLLGNATLGIVVAVLAATVGAGADVGQDGLYVILGLVAFGAAVAIGRVAAPALVAMSTTPSDALNIRLRFIRTGTIAEAAGSLAMAAAIALLFFG